jgi:hypothetical protein
MIPFEGNYLLRKTRTQEIKSRVEKSSLKIKIVIGNAWRLSESVHTDILKFLELSVGYQLN